MGRSSGGVRPIGRCLFLFMYIYFYMTLLMAGPSCFFVFSNRPGTVLGCRAHFWKFSITRGKRSRWCGCGLMMCTGVYWWPVLMCIDMCIDGSNDCESDSIKAAVHIGLVLLCPCAQTDRPKKNHPNPPESAAKPTKICKKCLWSLREN